MTILFCNVGWMESYNGIDGDILSRGVLSMIIQLVMKYVILLT